MFFVSISQHINLGVIEAISDKKAGTILKAIKSTMAIYSEGGFKVRHAVMDGAFVCNEEEVGTMGIQLNTTSRDEHVGVIEIHKNYQGKNEVNNQCSTFQLVPQPDDH